jgi:DNA-binding NarL/FixJ family response regulator
MIDLDQVKVTPREQQVLNLLVQGFTNKEIGEQMNISQRTVKQHLRMLFSRVGIHEGAKRVKLARYAQKDESAVMTPCEGLNPSEHQISVLVWEGMTNREIGKIIGTSEQVVKNHLRSIFDKLGVWNRLELAMYAASHRGREIYRNRAPQFLSTMDRSAPIPTVARFRVAQVGADNVLKRVHGRYSMQYRNQ